MKKFTLLFFILSFIFTATVNAQIKKGSVFLGGNIGGSTQKTKSGGSTVNNQNGLTISPVFGKAIKENLIIGADLGFSFYESNSSPTNPSLYAENRNDQYGAGVFIRKYKQIAKSGFSMFLQGGFYINYTSNEYENFPSSFNAEKRKRYGIGINAYPGLTYTVSKKLQLETGFNNLLSLGYFTEKREVKGSSLYTERTNGIHINSSLSNLSSLYIGFRVLIGKS